MTPLKNIAAAVASLVIFSNITNAQTAIPTSNQASSAPFTVKYLGSDEDYLLFEVSIASPNNSKGQFQLVDKNVGELYAAGISRSPKTQTLKIEKRDEQELDFNLRIGKTTYTRSFSVNSNVAENTTVSEMDLTKL